MDLEVVVHQDLGKSASKLNSETSNATTSYEASEPMLPKWLLSRFSVEDCKAIEKEILSAEKLTSGEIVPVIVRRSMSLGAHKKLLAVVVAFPILSAVVSLEVLMNWNPTYVSVISVAGILLIGSFLFFRPLPFWLLRFVTSKYERKKAALTRAELEFYREGVGHTVGRTGVLLFVSLEEHEAVVLADQSISSKLDANAWDQVLETLLKGFRKKRPKDGFCEAIQHVSQIISPLLPSKSCDVNELRNHLVIKD